MVTTSRPCGLATFTASLPAAHYLKPTLMKDYTLLKFVDREYARV